MDIFGCGCMSGTSVDGIDVVIVKFTGGRFDKEAMSVVHYEEHPYPEELRVRVREAMETGSTALVCQLNFEVGAALAHAISASLDRFGVRDRVAYVASHGQTLYHIPHKNDARDWHTLSTLQVGDGNVIAQITGVPLVVSDFRTADMALHGQGAPLVPFFDKWAFGALGKCVILCNVGGIANVTLLKPDGHVMGWDSGPGNCVIDVLCQRLFSEPCDLDGRYSAQGTVDDALFSEKIWPLASEYFDKSPPKSTGRELFNNAFVDSFVASTRGCSSYDMVRMAVELTARSIWAAVKQYSPHVVVVTGGGSRNPTLLRSLNAFCPSIPLEQWEHNLDGLTSANKEAVAFAVLGLATLRGVPSNVPSVTGAHAECLLGKVALGPRNTMRLL